MGFRAKELEWLIAVIVCICVSLGSTVGGTAEDAGTKDTEDGMLCYEIRSQVLESGKRLCDLEVPEYAVAADDTIVRGKLVWYFPETGTTLDEKLTVTGENGEEYIFGWRFIPAETGRTYEPVIGQITVTIRAANQIQSEAVTNPERNEESFHQDIDDADTDQGGCDTAINQEKGNRSAQEDGSDAEDIAGKETDGQSAGTETRKLWNTLVSAMANNTYEVGMEQETDRANVFGQTVGASSITVVPDGTDPSSLMGSMITGIGALGKTEFMETESAGVTESDKNSVNTDKDSAVTEKNAAETDKESTETKKETGGTDKGAEETDKDNGETGKDFAENDTAVSETEMNQEEKDAAASETEMNQEEKDAAASETEMNQEEKNAASSETDKESVETDSPKENLASDTDRDLEEAVTGGTTKAFGLTHLMKLFRRLAVALTEWMILEITILI